MDVVYTWVDDSFPGYREVLQQYAATKSDRNPNRTRDNLDLIKYSLRSLERFLPWVRNVYIVSCAPQIPAWLNTRAPGLHIVHHDAIMPAQVLPTFSSFSIVSSLVNIPGLTERFIYVEDDTLFGKPVTLEDFCEADGKLRVFPRRQLTPAAGQRTQPKLSGWNLALAATNHLLDGAFAPERRPHVNHVPLLVDQALWREMMERWKPEFDATIASRFRAMGNVAPDYLYPWFLHYTGRAAMAPVSQTEREAAYVPLENLPFVTALGLWRAQRRPPKFIALNDNFGDTPRPAIEARVRSFLNAAFPHKSRFEL